MEKYITRLQQHIVEVPKKFYQFSSQEVSQRPAPGKWSKKEIMGHLCDSALHNWQRFTSIINQSELFEIITYPQDDLVQLNKYQEVPIGNILSLWESMNRQIAQVLITIDKEKYNHPVRLPNGETKDLLFLAIDYVEHMEHHLRQVFGEKRLAPDLPQNWKLGVEEAVAILQAQSDSRPFATLLENGNMYIEIYQPEKVDLQVPHNQDEIYVVISGSGTFFNNGERLPFKSGDLIFVPAGIEHRFEDFSEDFKTWVIFY